MALSVPLPLWLGDMAHVPKGEKGLEGPALSPLLTLCSPLVPQVHLQVGPPSGSRASPILRHLPGSCCLQSLHWAVSPSTVGTTGSQESRWQRGPPHPSRAGLGSHCRTAHRMSAPDSVPQLPLATTTFPSFRRRSRAWLGAAIEGIYVSSSIPYF